MLDDGAWPWHTLATAYVGHAVLFGLTRIYEMPKGGFLALIFGVVSAFDRPSTNLGWASQHEINDGIPGIKLSRYLVQSFP
jgi:hypothetical protein